MKTLVFATNNENKLKEVREMLPNFEVLGLKDIDCHEEIPETENTFRGNALLKVDYVTQKYGYDCFADDSGLQIKALNNEPGIYSARYAGEPVNADNNIDKVLKKMKLEQDRSARFITVIALKYKKQTYYFEGSVNGEILYNRQGQDGFGYDPIFMPNGFDKTFAQMSMLEKSAISHRGKAVKQLVDFLNTHK